jgi:hypothetical protein
MVFEWLSNDNEIAWYLNHHQSISIKILPGFLNLKLVFVDWCTPNGDQVINANYTLLVATFWRVPINSFLHLFSIHFFLLHFFLSTFTLIVVLKVTPDNCFSNLLLYYWDSWTIFATTSIIDVITAYALKKHMFFRLLIFFNLLTVIL